MPPFLSPIVFIRCTVHVATSKSTPKTHSLRFFPAAKPLEIPAALRRAAKQRAQRSAEDPVSTGRRTRAKQNTRPPYRRGSEEDGDGVFRRIRQTNRTSLYLENPNLL